MKPGIPAKYTVTSNKGFLEKLKDFNHHKDDYCISFDIASLFTNIPLEETIHLVAKELYTDNNIKRPPIPKESLVILLKMATGGMFTHRNKIYQQCDGVSMGNPLAPTLANFFLGVLERKLFNVEQQDISDPVFYLRYVDDIFCIFRSGVKFEPFLEKLNGLHKNLTFTFEIGGRTIPFLDTNITLDGEGFSSTVYRKATNTDVVLNYGAVAPSAWKKGLVKCLVHRANVVCSNTALLRSEINQLTKIFYKNGYPMEVIDNIIQEYYENKAVREKNSNKSITSGDTNSAEEIRPKELLRVPYVGKPSILFSRRLRKLVKRRYDRDVRVVYNTTKVQDSFILKDDTPKEIQSKVVYRFTCPSDSDTQYIGYTNRPLRTRVTEHLRKGNSAISDHIALCKGCGTKGVTINNFEIIRKCRNKLETPIYEAILIQKYNPKLNRQLVKPGWQHKLMVFT